MYILWYMPWGNIGNCSFPHYGSDSIIFESSSFWAFIVCKSTKISWDGAINKEKSSQVSRCNQGGDTLQVSSLRNYSQYSFVRLCNLTILILNASGKLSTGQTATSCNDYPKVSVHYRIVKLPQARHSVTLNAWWKTDMLSKSMNGRIEDLFLRKNG